MQTITVGKKAILFDKPMDKFLFNDMDLSLSIHRNALFD